MGCHDQTVLSISKEATLDLNMGIMILDDLLPSNPQHNISFFLLQTHTELTSSMSYLAQLQDLSPGHLPKFRLPQCIFIVRLDIFVKKGNLSPSFVTLCGRNVPLSSASKRNCSSVESLK